MVLRGLRSAVTWGASGEHTLHIHKARNCLWSVPFHSSHNSGETVLELRACCTAPLHPQLCSSVPFRPGSIKLQRQSRSARWPWLTVPGTRAGAALPCPGPRLQHPLQLSCVTGAEMWRQAMSYGEHKEPCEHLMEWLLSIAEMELWL